MTQEPGNHLVDKVRHFLRIDRLHPVARKIFAALVGGTILLVGIVMLIAPGPAVIVIPLGLMILGSEFIWAQKISEKIARQWQKVKDRWRRSRLKPGHDGDGMSVN